MLTHCLSVAYCFTQVTWRHRLDCPTCEQPVNPSINSSEAHSMQVLMGILERARDLQSYQLPQPESPAGRERLPER